MHYFRSICRRSEAPSRWATLLLFLLPPLTAAAAESQVSVSLSGRNISDKIHQARTAGVKVEGKTSQPLLPDVILSLDVGANLESGSFHSRYVSPYRPERTLKLRQAEIHWRPHRSWELAGGVLNQGDLFPGGLLLSDQGFPALRQRYLYERGGFRGGITAQQAVAVSADLAQVPRGPENATPSFFYERLEVGFRSASDFRWHGHVGHFLFSRLPPSMAYESRFLGNTVSGLSRENSRYVQGFQGFDGGMRLQWRGRRWRPEAFLHGWWNTKAGDETGLAGIAGVSAPLSLSPAVTLTPELRLFRIGSDAFPAAYGNPALGHGNRRGYSLGLEVGLDRHHLKLGGRFIQAGTLTETPYQGRFQAVQVFVTKHYEIL